MILTRIEDSKTLIVKTRKIGGGGDGTIELSAGENGVVLEDDKKKKKKNDEEHEVSVDDAELSGGRIQGVKEGDVKDKKKKNKDILESGSNDAGFNDNKNNAVMGSDVLKVKKRKKKSKKMDDCVNDFESGTTQSAAVIEGDFDRSIIEKEKEKKKKKKKRKIEEVVEWQMNQEEQDFAATMKGEESDQRKKKKQCKKDMEGGGVIVLGKVTNREDKIGREQLDGNLLEKIELSGKEKGGKSKKHINAVSDVSNEVKDKDENNDAMSRNIDERIVIEEGSKKEKKKAKSMKDHSKGGSKKVPRTEKGIPIENSTQKESFKKVSFSDQAEVFPSDAKSSNDGLVHGKRFSLEEDEIIKKAVLNYIESHRLGEEGVNMVLNCRSHPEVKNCWKEISAALPWRPSVSIYQRAHILFLRDEKHKWTPDELDFVRKFHEKHRSDWKTIADVLGKHRIHVRDAWRRIKLPNIRKGRWSQEEYQKLFDLVNIDLLRRTSEEKKSKYGMLRDNICWEAICEKLETRTNSKCCTKWYYHLTSPLVAEGKWRDTDDYHMLTALSNLDACCMEDVNWDNLVDGRPGVVCRKRWNQMVKHLGPGRHKSFAEQVEILSTRYYPDVLEAREAYNSKPAVD